MPTAASIANFVAVNIVQGTHLGTQEVSRSRPELSMVPSTGKGRRLPS